MSVSLKPTLRVNRFNPGLFNKALGRFERVGPRYYDYDLIPKEYVLVYREDELDVLEAIEAIG